MIDLRDLELVHYGEAPLTVVTVPQHDRIGMYKPRGLWVSVKGPDDWPTWCTSEGFKDTSTQHETRVILAEPHHVLHLASEESIDDFTWEYSAVPRYSGDCSIDWPKVESHYYGLVIAPYCWSRRMTDHTFWYYGWDCASGCLWNPAAVAYVEPSDASVSQGVRLNAAAGKD